MTRDQNPAGAPGTAQPAALGTDTHPDAGDAQQAALYARIDQAAADAAAALRTLTALVHTHPEMGTRVRALTALIQEPAGPLAALAAVFSDLYEDLQEFEHEDAEEAAEDLEQARAGLGPVFEHLDTALGRVRDLA